MSNTTTAVDEVWGWLYQPLQDLRQDHATDPDKPWDTRRQAFLEQLGLSDAADHPVTQLLFQRLETLSDEDRHDLLNAGEIDNLAYAVVQECSPEAAQESNAYDEGAWHQFVAANLPSWNGAADSWGQFAEWFSYHAGQANLSVPARAFIDQVAGLSNEERISTIARYGVSITAPAGTPADQVPPAEGSGRTRAADESTTALMDEILKERPELAAIPEQRRLELIAQVLEEEDDEDED
jgi:hypothetical protein